MANVPANIIVGEPTSISIVTYGAAEGAVVGYTEGGAQIVPNSEYYRVKADQSPGVLDVVLTGREPILKFNIAEGQLQNLQWAIGYDAGGLVDANNLDFGGSKTVDKYTIYLNTPGPTAGATRKYTIHRAVSIGNPEISHMKDDKVVYACEFLILQDTSKAEDKQFIEIDDSGVDTTPPTVAMTAGAPGDGNTVVAASSEVIQLTFTEAGAGMDEKTLIYGDLDNATIHIYDVENPAVVVLKAGTATYNSGTKIWTFTPGAVWETAGRNFMITVNTNVKDMAGNNLASTYIGHFSTA